MNEFITDCKAYSGFKYAKTIDGHQILVNPNDIYIGRTILQTGVWEQYLHTLLQSIVKPGMITIDIGANIGAHTLTLSKLVGSSGHVYAFEPCTINHDILLFNCIANHCDNVTVMKLGCDKVEKIMYIDEIWNQTKTQQNYGCVVLRSEKITEEQEVIRTATIDSFNFEQVGFMKIDAEYMEEEVLLGAMQTIKKYRPIIVIEVHVEQIPIIKPLLDSLNYSFDFIGGYDFLALPR